MDNVQFGELSTALLLFDGFVCLLLTAIQVFKRLVSIYRSECIVLRQCEVDRQNSLVFTATQLLYQHVRMKNEPRSYQLKSIASILWVLTEGIRLQIQVAEISFCCNVYSPKQTALGVHKATPLSKST